MYVNLWNTLFFYLPECTQGNTPLQTAKSKNSRKPVTPAGMRLSLAASEELPDPLPIPQYSEKV